MGRGAALTSPRGHTLFRENPGRDERWQPPAGLAPKTEVKWLRATEGTHCCYKPRGTAERLVLGHPGVHAMDSLPVGQHRLGRRILFWGVETFTGEDGMAYILASDRAGIESGTVIATFATSDDPTRPGDITGLTLAVRDIAHQ